MKKGLVTWLVVAACAALACGALAWVSVTTLRLERAEAEGRRTAAVEERVRLALWRMDGRMARLVAEESTRSADQWEPFYVPARAFDDAGKSPVAATTRIASPLLEGVPDGVRLHFALNEDGTWTSPQVPRGKLTRLALLAGITEEDLAAADTDLGLLSRTLDLESLRAFDPGAAESRQLVAALVNVQRQLPPAVADKNQALASNEGQGTRLEVAQQDERQRSGDPRLAQVQVAPPSELDSEQLLYAQNNVPSTRSAIEYSKRSQQYWENATPSKAPQRKSASFSGNSFGSSLGNASSAPQQAMPQQAMPQRAMPQQAMPQQAMPQQAMPQQAMPQQAMPQLRLPAGDEGRPPAATGAEQVQAQQQTAPPRQAQAPAAAAPEPTRPQPRYRTVRTAVESEVRVSPMVPVWIDEELLLVRHVDRAGERTVQGVWLDWPRVRELLLEEVGDLLPNASLERVAALTSGDLLDRRLASLPVRLVPGAVPLPPADPSSVGWVLGAAWFAVLLSLVAIALLLLGALSLSERRAAFVSAVTHELRTPLTTFRMYAEMLSDGMVADETQRAGYYETLKKESNRLAHLVENVLSYARLERKRSPRAAEAMPLAELLRNNLRRAEERAMDAGMELCLELDAAAEALRVRADPAAAEQVLFNLVDNACKYAREASDKRIHVRAEQRGGRVAVVVSDHGEGVPRSVARTLFEPFSKSSEAAAESAPGVGLGLALSRRLARAMGGDLRYEGAPGKGAVFALVLAGA